MNAEFRTHAGVVFSVRDDFGPPPADAKPGSIYETSRRVWLSAFPTDTRVAFTSPLTKSEARAIASALMGAAAEL